MKERDYDFYGNVLDMERVEQVLQYVIKNLNLKEILKMTREITYDMVRPEAHLYKGDYSELNIEQANRFQTQLRDMCDFLAQSLVDKREFDEGYLKDYEYARVYLKIIKDLKEAIKDLRQEIVDMRME